MEIHNDKQCNMYSLLVLTCSYYQTHASFNLHSCTSWILYRGLSNCGTTNVFGLNLPPSRILVCELQFFYQYLQLIGKHILNLSGFLRLIIKIPYQGTDCLTRLKHETNMVSQSLKGLCSCRSSPNNTQPQAVHTWRCSL